VPLQDEPSLGGRLIAPHLPGTIGRIDSRLRCSTLLRVSGFTLVTQNKSSEENSPKRIPQRVENGHNCSTQKIANMHPFARIYFGYLALLFHGQCYPFERERDFDAAIGSLPPSLVRLDAVPLSSSKVRFKKSTSRCLRPGSRSSSAIRNSAALNPGGDTVGDLLPCGRPIRRFSPALPSASNWWRH
jgi:hypothetical protein